MPQCVAKPKPETIRTFENKQLTTGPWTISPATGGDQETLAAIYLQMRRATFTWVDPIHFQPEDFVAQSKGETVLVCRAGDGAIAGFIAYWDEDGFIHMLYVRSEFPGLGAATALLQALPGWPSRRYRLKCLVKNTRARQFYQSIGFVVSGTGTSSDGDYTDMTLGPVVRRR